MNNHWYDVPGWVDDYVLNYYRDVVDGLPPDSIICEVGCYMGKSTCYILSYAKSIGRRDIKYYAVDHFRGTEGEPEHQELIRKHGGDLYSCFVKNLAAAGVLHDLCIVKNDSWQAARLFPKEMFDWVYLDGDHRYEEVYRDIDAWYPKVKRGGTLAGHDMNCRGVYDAVHEAFQPQRVSRREGHVWLVNKETGDGV